MPENLNNILTSQSVRHDEMDGQYPPLAYFYLPSVFFNEDKRGLLPSVLPPYQYRDYYFSPRMEVLLSTPRYESQWATAVGKAASKMASKAFEVESNAPRLRAEAQELLLYRTSAGNGLFGWVPFLNAHLWSYLCTGYGFIEVERATNRNGSKILGLHHLNPLRCRLTNDWEYPVEYMRLDGTRVKMAYWQVIVMVDMPDPTEGYYFGGFVLSAAERAYDQIKKLNAIEWFVYEKVSGKRPLGINFIRGIADGQLEDVIKGAEHDSQRRNYHVYQGAALVGVPIDQDIQVVTVPLAELPDGFNALEERQRADLVYANAIGLDPQDLNPQLLASGSIGTGTQAKVLADKASGSRLASWQPQFIHNINGQINRRVTIGFSERDPLDEQEHAKATKLRLENLAILVQDIGLSSDQAINMAVDAGDVPEEFLPVDQTDTETLRDDEKPVSEAEREQIAEEEETADNA